LVALAGMATAGSIMTAPLVGDLAASAQPAPLDGQRLFVQCAACHSLVPGARSGVGPNLTGMFGKRAGTVASDFRYSDALKASTIVWTDATLDSFIAAPKQDVPGTRMIFRGVAKPADRAAIVTYLKTKTVVAP